MSDGKRLYELYSATFEIGANGDRFEPGRVGPVAWERVHPAARHRWERIAKKFREALAVEIRDEIFKSEPIATFLRSQEEGERERKATRAVLAQQERSRQQLERKS